jgi:hypothetical protein
MNKSTSGWGDYTLATDNLNGRFPKLLKSPLMADEKIKIFAENISFHLFVVF